MYSILSGKQGVGHVFFILIVKKIGGLAAKDQKIIKENRNYSANQQIQGTQSRFPSVCNQTQPENQVMSPEFADIHQYSVFFYSR